MGTCLEDLGRLFGGSSSVFVFIEAGMQLSSSTTVSPFIACSSRASGSHVFHQPCLAD